MASVSKSNDRNFPVDGAGLDPASLDAIRRMTSKDPAPAPRTPRAAPERATKAAALPPLDAAPAEPAAQPPHASAPARRRFRLPAFRPGKGHIVLGAVLLLAFFKPWLVFGLLFLWLFVLTGLFLTFGFDEFWHGVVKLVRRYGRHRPHRAAKLHRRLDSFAVKWDTILDRFPEGMVDGLYLPDIGELEVAPKRQTEGRARRMGNLQTGAAGSA